MRIFLAAAVIAFVVAPAFAQESHMQGYREESKERTAAEKAADKAAQDAYRRSLSAIPDQGPTDPWGTMRGNNEPKGAATKSPNAKTKTGSAEAKSQ